LEMLVRPVQLPGDKRILRELRAFVHHK
jgi:hypothetical protein